MNWEDIDVKLLITVDNLSTRYNKLPSQILAEATTFDLLVANTGLQWQQKQQEDAEAEREGRPKAQKISQAEMFEMLRRVKERKDETKS